MPLQGHLVNSTNVPTAIITPSPNSEIMHKIKKMAIGLFILVTITSAGLSLNLISIIPAQAQTQMQPTTQNNTVPANSNTTAQGKPVLVHISSGNSNNTHEVHSAQMGVDHALSLLRAGSDVAILLDVDGVRIAAMNVDPKLKAESDNLKTFLKEGGRVIACDHCISMAGLNNKDMLSGVEIDTHPAMPGMQKFLNQDNVVVLDY
ncbi:MAG TPA: DsrE family protein [Nitrososphaeraceae archaeon]